jgi:hypothetical protein
VPVSDSVFETMAVELIASTPPRTRPVCQLKPIAHETAITIAITLTTWAEPKPNTIRRIARSWGRLNSRPIENIRKTTPNSARARWSSVSATMPRA